MKIIKKVSKDGIDFVLSKTTELQSRSGETRECWDVKGKVKGRLIVNTRNYTSWDAEDTLKYFVSRSSEIVAQFG